MRLITLLFFLAIHTITFSQAERKQTKAFRATGTIKIDGIIDEADWNQVQPITNLIEHRPNPGAVEDSTNRTLLYILYDNSNVYVAGYCYEKNSSHISKELIGRDKIGVNDFVGVVLDTYNDKINAVGFYVTPYGEQADMKYSVDNEDMSWSAVWESNAKIHDNGWSFEMRIPYSALRFVSNENQTWGLNFVRRRNKTSQQYTWNAIDPKVRGFINQEGQWTGIGKINAPVRLSFSPYFSSYVNHYKPDNKPWSASVNGGMDVKYGLSESFTLDMTLIPDFGQVRSDNQVLNLSPFEVKYNENRSFFTEGTELFSKGDLFYSRRIGGTPLNYGSVNGQLNPGEKIVKNPQEARLINATKISGRTKGGLGIGFFNAITKTMYAGVENTYGEIRKVETNPLTNYNIIVLDQTLKNNSSVSFINTNVLRSGMDYDANVSAGLFNINNKKNTFNWNGKFAVSQVSDPFAKNKTGYSHNIGFGKTGGRWNFQLGQEIADKNYDINDMGILFTRNYVEHYLWSGYRWVKPKDWYNRVQVNVNAFYSNLYQPFENQKIHSKFQNFRANINANAQFKNLWWMGAFAGYVPSGNDFYEPRETGYSFKTSERANIGTWLETNEAKKYCFSLNYYLGIRKLFNSQAHELSIMNRYRFNDKFSLSQNTNLNLLNNDAGFARKFYEPDGINPNALKDIIFSRRNQKTIENILEAKYNFNTRSGITFRARHYWSKVQQHQLYDLNNNGTLSPTKHNLLDLQHQNFNIFNIDAVYTWQFAPGSFINIVWKDQGLLFNKNVDYKYFQNFKNTISEPLNNNLSLKVIYFLEYLDLKKWSKKKVDL